MKTVISFCWRNSCVLCLRLTVVAFPFVYQVFLCSFSFCLTSYIFFLEYYYYYCKNIFGCGKIGVSSVFFWHEVVRRVGFFSNCQYTLVFRKLFSDHLVVINVRKWGRPTTSSQQCFPRFTCVLKGCTKNFHHLVAKYPISGSLRIPFDSLTFILLHRVGITVVVELSLSISKIFLGEWIRSLLD